MVNVLGAVAQWEREATAERTSAALQVLKQQGRATGGVNMAGGQGAGHVGNCWVSRSPCGAAQWEKGRGNE